MKTLFINIKELLQVREAGIAKVAGKEMSSLPSIENAYLLVENDSIVAFGPMAECPAIDGSVVDAEGKYILPTWCDSHTHIVYAGNREMEFVDRIKGATYEEIAAKGGGILNSAKKLLETSEDELYRQSELRLREVMALGTGAVEIKSGYGLTVEGELKMLRVIRRLNENHPVEIKSTFLGAHAFPAEYKNDPDGYVRLMTDRMLPRIAEENLATYIDVFCEKGYFSIEQTEEIMKAGLKFGLIPKIHVNQFNAFGGVKAAVENGALSVDHLELLNDDDITALQGSDTMPVALPACSFFLSIPYTPARKVIDAGLPLALATDFNPGSSPTGNMNFVVACGCIKMKMTPEEAINAATINGAYAMGLSETHGSITVGKKASLVVTKRLSSWFHIPYAFGSDHIDKVMIGGKFIS